MELSYLSILNARFEILKYADEKKLHIDEWVEETICATRKLSERKLGGLLLQMKKDDILLVSELSPPGTKSYGGYEYSAYPDGEKR